MLKIWGRRNSTNVKKVLWCAEELGLAYQQVDAGGAFGIVSTPEYRALNPNGLVPTIEDDGFVLWESNVIVRYLAARYGKDPFYPKDIPERAKAEQWMDWASTSLAGPLRDVMWNLVRASETERDLKAVEAGITRWSQLCAIADAALARQPYFGGEQFTIADIAIGPYAYVWYELPITRPEHTHLRMWYEELKRRPAFQKTVMIPLT